jgi:saccharopine dehydrogenase (NAD+, L-lysine-forming)
MTAQGTGDPLCLGIRREDKSRWERRAPITPEDAAALAQQHGIASHVQPSPNRIFSDDEYRAAGAIVQEDLASCSVIFAVKEIAPSFLEPSKTYAFFSHVSKGQPHNMPMLRRLLDLGCNLIDYERVVDDNGRRLIFFGRHAGIAGTLETLWALGQRLAWEGIPNPFEMLRHAYEYRDLAEAQADVARAGERIREAGIPKTLRPLIIGVTGYGNVARGAWEILDLLPVQRIDPAEATRPSTLNAAGSTIWAVTFREEHLVEPIPNTESFDLQDYYTHPERHRGVFERYVPHLTAIVNAIYWEPRYPRLITKAYLGKLFGAGKPRLRVIGDISCDIEGSMECTVRTTLPDDPVFVYLPASGEINSGVAGDGVVVMAVDILPSELPHDASVEFSRVLKSYVPAIAGADYSQPFEQLDLPPEIKRAVIVYHGQLTPDYTYLAKFLTGEHM